VKLQLAAMIVKQTINRPRTLGSISAEGTCGKARHRGSGLQSRGSGDERYYVPSSSVRRHTRRTLLGTAAFSLAVFLVGCSSRSKASDAQRPATSTSSASSQHGSSSSSTTHDTTVPQGDLGALMPTTVPSGFTLQPDDVGDTGPSDLEKAVRDDGDAGARVVLTHAGFVRGFQRLWAASDSEDENILFLYQFRDTAGAREYLDRSRAMLGSGGQPAPVAFAVPQIPTAFGFGQHDRTGSTAVSTSSADRMSSRLS
jgi:hypothetical protein